MGETPQVDFKVDASEDTRFLSRKFILTVVVLLMVGILPMIYKSNGVSETVTLTVLCLLGAVGAAYGFMNVRDAKVEVEKAVAKVMGEKSETYE
jgi:hypothetical protein